MSEIQKEITFPAQWEFRIIAFHDQVQNVIPDVVDIFRKSDFDIKVEPGKISREGKYQALHVSTVMPNREVLNKISLALAAVKGVKMLL